MGKKLITSVLYVINEVELSIYRFLSSGAKKSKRQPQSVKLGVDSLVVGAFNALAGYRCLERTSTGGRQGRREPQSGRENYWMKESVFYIS